MSNQSKSGDRVAKIIFFTLAWIFIAAMAIKQTFNLVRIYLPTTPTTHSCEHAADIQDIKALKEAADAGCPKDQFNLATLYFNG